MDDKFLSPRVLTRKRRTAVEKKSIELLVHCVNRRNSGGRFFFLYICIQVYPKRIKEGSFCELDFNEDIGY